MLKIENNPEKVKFVKDLEYLEDLIWHDRPLIWLAKAPDGKIWLGTWQDIRWEPQPAQDQTAYFEFDVDVMELLKAKPYLDVLKMAKSVIVHDHYFILYQGSTGREEAQEFTIEKWLELSAADNALPDQSIMLFK